MKESNHRKMEERRIMMRKRIVTLITALAMLCSAVSPVMELKAQTKAQETGTTYYVSTLHGKDTNSGTSQNEPFYSLQKINHQNLGPGDRILLEAGSVFTNGYLHLFGQSGSEEAPIVIDRYGEGADPIIDTNGQGVWFQNYGQRLDNAWHKYQGYVSSSILLYDTEYIEIQNLEIVNDNPEIDTVYNATDMMDRTGVAAVAQDKGTIDHIHLKNLKMHDVIGNVYNKHMNNGGIYFTVYLPHDAQMGTPSDNKADFISSETGISRYNDVLIEGCSVINTNRWGIAVGYTGFWNKFTNMEISDEDIAKYGSTNVVIRNNYVKDAGGDSITLMYCDKPLVEYNVSDGAARQMHSGDYSPQGETQRFAAGIWPWKCKDAVFQYNEAFDTQNVNNENGDGQAWDADWSDGTIYQYNYSHNNGGGCLMVCLNEAYRTTFRYNVSQNDLRAVLDTFGSPKAHIYNNVFYIAENVPVYRDRSNGEALLENNIFYYSGNEEKEENWTVGNNKTYKNNLYYNYANTPTDVAGVIAAKGTQVFEDPGKAPESTTGKLNEHEDPEIASVFDGYKLADNSPAIGVGKEVEDANGYEPSEKDFFGNDITEVTVFDIGAYQHPEETGERPQRPARPEIGETTEHTVSISWAIGEDAAQIKGYKIKDGKTVIKDLTGDELAAATSGATISITLEGLNSGTEYTFGIVAYDANGTESLPRTVKFKTAGQQGGEEPNPPDPIKPPTPAKPEEGEVTENSAQIIWAAPGDLTGIAGYKIKNGEKVLKDLTGEELASAIKDGKISITIDGLQAGASYTLTIVAYNEDGVESSPQTVTIKTAGQQGGEEPNPPDPIKPPTPAKPEEGQVTENSAQLVWAAPENLTGIAGYKIKNGEKVLKDLTGEELASAIKDGKVSVTIDGLQAGTNYTLTIIAYDENGVESSPVTIQVKTSGSAAIVNTSKPSMPAKPSVSGISQTGATVSWAMAASSEAVTGYKIKKGNAILLNITGQALKNATRAGKVTAKIGNLKAGTSYSLSLIASNKNGDSAARAFTFKTASALEPSIKLDQTKLTLYTKAKKNATLKAVVANIKGTVTWTSSNPKVATVSNGKVTAKKAGTAVITATVGSVKAICNVTVKKPTIKVKKSVSVRKGKKLKLKVKATPSGKITYKSKNKKIATVTKKGSIKGIKKGSCTITVKCNGVTKKVKVKVK